MGQKDELITFTRDALVAGRDRHEIAAALARAGWSPGEVETALKAFSDEPFSPPVPRPRPIVSARDFFVYALIFFTLLGAAGHLIALLHALIDILLYAEELEGRYSTVRWSVSVLIVVAPLYALLSLREERRVRTDPAAERNAIRKWAHWLTLLIAAVVLIGDLVVVIYNFLDGGWTGEFLLKALVVALVAAVIGLHYGGLVRDREAGA